MAPLSDADEPGFDEIRDFVANEAAVLTRLEDLLSNIGREVRARSAVGLDRDAMWRAVEQRLGWGSGGQAAEPDPVGR